MSAIMTIKYLFFIFNFIACVFANSPITYGSFDLSITKCKVCKGPRRNECSNTSLTIIDDKILHFDLNMKQNMSPTNGKIIAKTNGKQFLRLQMKRPCDHLFLRPLLQSIMNITNDCVIPKGAYHFNVDIEQVAQKYYAGMFLYGNFTFISVFYSNECNLSCYELDVSTYPKSKS